MKTGVHFLVLLAGLLWMACGGIPVIHPIANLNLRADLKSDCESVFPRGKWNVVHAMEVTLPMGKKTSLMGASVGVAATGAVKSVLLSPEGIVLFDAAIENDEIRTHRALPPLEDPEFATRMFADIHLMFFQPPGNATEVGRMGDGRLVCRWRQKSGIVDVVMEAGGGWRIQKYNSGGLLSREAVARPPFSKGFAREMILTAFGLGGYKMRFGLLRVEAGS